MLIASLLAAFCLVLTASPQEPDNAPPTAKPVPEVSKLLPVESAEAWAARQQRLAELGPRIKKEIEELTPRSHLQNVITNSLSVACLRLQLHSIATVLADSVAGQAKSANAPPAFHYEAVVSAKAYPLGSTFFAAMSLFSRDLPPYEQGPSYTPNSTEEVLQQQTLHACSKLRELMCPDSSKTLYPGAANAYLTAETVEAILRDLTSYEEHCKARRWSEAQVIGDVYWSALRQAILDGVIEVPKFGAATSPTSPAANASARAARLLAPAAMIAWIDRETLAAEKARGRAAVDSRLTGNPQLLRSLDETRKGYVGWLGSRKKHLEDQQTAIANARIHAEELERVGDAARAAEERERCQRLERQLHADFASEIRDFAQSQSQTPQLLMRSMYFCLLDLDTFDPRFAPVFAAIDGAIKNTREELVQRRTQMRQQGTGEVGAKLGAFLREFEPFAEWLIGDLTKMKEANDRRDAEAVRAVLAPLREALRGSTDPIAGSLAASARPAAEAKPAVVEVVWRTYDLDFATTKAREDAARSRLQKIRKGMRAKNHTPTESEHLAELRAITAWQFYRAAVERMRPVEHGRESKRTLRLVDVDGGGPYGFAKFDPACLADAEALKALRDAWQRARDGLARETANLATPANQIAATKVVLADLDRAIDLLAKDNAGELRTFLDALWVKVLAE